MLLASRPGVRAINYDALTYAGNLENLSDVADDKRYEFVHADICDSDRLLKALRTYRVDTVFHFAAETQVDRSIVSPVPFIQTNVNGMLSVLEAVRAANIQRLIQVSTDEVYGSLGPTGRFTESSPLNPNNPYAASKASADHLCRTWHRTFGVPVIVTRCCNNFGPYQVPEKLIPAMITRAMAGARLPIYGDGMNARDWIHVTDHCQALLAAAECGRTGEIYNIAGENEQVNIDLVRLILKMLNRPESLIQLVRDRPGHDKRYALDPDKARRELGWKASSDFVVYLHRTIQWYLDNESWWRRAAKSGGRPGLESEHDAEANQISQGVPIVEPLCLNRPESGS